MAAQAAALLLLAFLLAISRTRSWRRGHPVLGAPDLRTAAAVSSLAILLGLSRARRWRAVHQPVRRAGHAIRDRVEGGLDRADDLLAEAEAAIRSGAARLGRSVSATFSSAGREASAPWSGTRDRAPFRPAAPARFGLREGSARRTGFIARNLPVAAAIALAAGLGTAALPSLLTAPQPAPSSDIRTAAAGTVPALAVGPAARPFQPPSKSEGGQVAGGGRDASAAAEPYRIAWPYDIADGLTFGPEGATKTRLAGLEGPARDAVCNDRYNQPWACGLQARAALNNVTRRQNLACEPAASPRPGAAAIPARCKGDVDVAKELVLSGFARPLDRDPALEQAEDDARRNERGLWNGGWTIRMSAK